MDTDVREALYERTKGYCEACGRPMAYDAMAAHHRRQGKRSDWRASNLLGVHHGCHNLAKGSIHDRPKQSYLCGFLVPSDMPTEKYPVLYHSAHWVLLLDDWTTTPTVVQHEEVR